ncbi:MAG: glycoside hydrolase family 31 protein [bacterium]|nr:glycoside hydrolase family 31 protein [bacterium]
MKKWIFGAMMLAGACAFAATPGRVVKMVPQSGTSKAFDVITENNITLRLQFYTPRVFRVLAAPATQEPYRDRYGNPVKDKEGNVKTYTTANYADPLNKPEKAQILTEGAREDSSRVLFADNREAGTYTFTTPDIIVTLNKADATLAVTDRLGNPIFEEAAPIDIGDIETTQTLKLGKDEFFYGGGQQNGFLCHNGRKIDIVADGNWEEGGHPNPAPWYITNKGYGVLRHTFSVGAYDFSGADTVRTVHRERRFDAFYFVGGDFKGTLDLYTQFTGRPNFIPMWGLELGDADAYMTRDPETRDPKQEEDGSYVELTHVNALEIAKKYREHNMPGGWLLVNDGYGCNHMQLAYTVNTLRDLGFRTGLWTEGALDLIGWEVGTAGSRVQKIDVAWSGPAYQHGLECNKVAAEGIENNSDARAFVWTCQGWAGTQRYGICWTGDQYGSWDLIRYHIPTLTCSSMSGQAYATTDVDGIFGGSPETYLRDMQWKCWTPAIYVMNGWSHVNKGPWSYEEPYRSLIRDALNHKMRMTPFFYAYMRNAWDCGEPIIRPLFWNYPNDRYTWDETTKYQYMVGKEVLIAPVYNSMKLNKGWKKDIYLPEGTWVDYNDGRRIDGPVTIPAYPIDLGKLPIFVKAGSILPMYPQMLSMGEKAPDPLTFDIYPKGEASFTVYEDDGETRAYQKGEYSKQLVECSAPEVEGTGDITVRVNPAVGDFKGMLKQRIYAFEIHMRTKPTQVFIDGEEMLELDDLSVYEHARQGWRYDADDRYGTLYVKLHRRDVTTTAELLVRVDPALAATIEPTAPYPIPEITNELDKAEFVVTSSSWANDCPAKNAFDGTEETMWHTYYATDAKRPLHFPHSIDIDMNGLYPINAVTYLPRQNLGNGVVKGYEVWVARFPGQYTLVKKGQFETFDKAEPRTLEFGTTWGRYVRLVFTSSQNGDKFASAAEIDILQDLNAAPLPDETQPICNETLTVDGQRYDNCRKVQVGTEWTLDLDGTWEKVLGHAGMETRNGNEGTVTFRIYADGKQIFERLGMKPTDVKQLINVDIPTGAKQLKFVFSKQSDDCNDDATGVWTDMRFFRAGSGK